jgi:NAD(P)-dependent dehydrogenase (short-subunit alcohol dehydrogenase family)
MPSILITGANRGLGYEFAKQYAADGWQVYAAARKRLLETLDRTYSGKFLNYDGHEYAW